MLDMGKRKKRLDVATGLCRVPNPPDNDKICHTCKKGINLKIDHYVQLSTMNRKKSPDDHAFFHFQCFVDYINKKVEDKAREQVKMMQQKALQVFDHPIMRDLLSKVQGSDGVMTMLQTPLISKSSILKKKVEDKLTNDRRKRSTKKRET